MAGETIRTRAADKLADLVAPGADANEMATIVNNAANGIKNKETEKLSNIIAPGADTATLASVVNQLLNGTSRVAITLANLVAPGASAAFIASILSGQGTVIPDILLSPLSLTNTSATVGQPFSSTVVGKTAGSTLSLTGAGAAGLTISGNFISGTPTTFGILNIVETLAGAVNSPLTTNNILSVSAALPAIYTIEQVGRLTRSGVPVAKLEPGAAIASGTNSGHFSIDGTGLVTVSTAGQTAGMQAANYSLTITGSAVTTLIIPTEANAYDVTTGAQAVAAITAAKAASATTDWSIYVRNGSVVTDTMTISTTFSGAVVDPNIGIPATLEGQQALNRAKGISSVSGGSFKLSCRTPYGAKIGAQMTLTGAGPFLIENLDFVKEAATDSYDARAIVVASNPGDISVTLGGDNKISSIVVTDPGQYPLSYAGRKIMFAVPGSTPTKVGESVIKSDGTIDTTAVVITSTSTFTSGQAASMRPDYLADVAGSQQAIQLRVQANGTTLASGVIRNNRFGNYSIGSRPNFVPCCVDVRNADKLIVSNNILDGFYKGIQIWIANDVSIRHNSFTHYTNDAINFYPSSAPLSGQTEVLAREHDNYMFNLMEDTSWSNSHSDPLQIGSPTDAADQEHLTVWNYVYTNGSVLKIQNQGFQNGDTTKNIKQRAANNFIMCNTTNPIILWRCDPSDPSDCAYNTVVRSKGEVDTLFGTNSIPATIRPAANAGYRIHHNITGEIWEQTSGGRRITADPVGGSLVLPTAGGTYYADANTYSSELTPNTGAGNSWPEIFAGGTDAFEWGGPSLGFYLKPNKIRTDTVANMKADIDAIFAPKAGSIAVGKGHTQDLSLPAIVPTGIMGFGDSRLQKSSAYTSSAGTFSQSRLFSGGYLLGIESAIDYKLLPSATGVYAVGASTTRNGTLRLNSSSNATTGNTASTETGDSADAAFNSQSTGEFTPLTDPANIVFYMYSVNDGSYATYFNDPKKSMLEIAAHLDAFATANKFVFLSNETPGGRGYIQNEVKAVTSLACQTTQTAAVSVVRLLNKDTGVRYNKVTTLTATGQYAVSATGAITFFTGDTIANAQIDYNYGTAVSGTYRNTVHNWLSSNAANFVDPDSGVDYAIPGALYNRPLVRSVNTWDAMKNPATSGANTVNKDGATPDALHGNISSATANGAAFKAAFDAVFPSLTRKDKQITKNGVLFATGNGTLTTFSGTLPTVGMVPVPTGKLKVIAGTVVGIDDGAGNITGTGISGTINYTTGALSVTFTTAPLNGVYIEAYANLGANLILNGLLDPAQGNGTVTPTGVTGLPPKGWSFSSMDTDLQTAVTGGAATVTLDTTQTDPVSGLPELRVSIRGVIGGSAAAAGNLSFANLVRTPTNRLTTTGTGDKVRATGVVRVIPGPGGTVQGNLGGQIKAQLQTSTAVTRPGANGAASNTAVTIASAIAGAGAAGTPFDDQDMVAGQHRMALLTQPVDASGMTLTNVQVNALVQFEKGKYVDVTVCFSQLGLQTY